MSREAYRNRVEIFRRQEPDGDYARIGETSAEVRDEKWESSEQAESEHIADLKIFVMRARVILSDDLLRWRGEFYRVIYPDEYNHTGREIRVRTRRSRSRYTIKGANAHGETGD